MRRIIIVILSTILFTGSVAYACTAFLTGQTTSGFNRICYYNHLGSTVAITIKATEMCPLSIKLND